MKAISILIMALGCLLSGCEKQDLIEEPKLTSSSVNIVSKIEGDSMAMPISTENCEELWTELSEIRNGRASVTKLESFPDEFLIVDGFSALKNLGFDPDKTIRSFILLSPVIDLRSSCRQIDRLVPNDMEKAVSKGLVSDRTRRVYEEFLRFPPTTEAPILFEAVEKCQTALSTPCPLTKLMDYHPGGEFSGKLRNGKTLSEIIESGDSDALSSFITYSLECNNLSNQLLINENGERLDCKKLHANSTLSVDSAALTDWKESLVFLDGERKSLGIE